VPPVPVEIITTPQTEESAEDVEVIDDLDEIASTEIMLGCGDDNPYQ
jgi:hypothetical protein